jgi:hypothetical protein
MAQADAASYVVVKFSKQLVETMGEGAPST